MARKKKKVEEKQAFSERDLNYYGKELYCNRRTAHYRNT